MAVGGAGNGDETESSAAPSVASAGSAAKRARLAGPPIPPMPVLGDGTAVAGPVQDMADFLAAIPPIARAGERTVSTESASSSRIAAC